MSTGRHPSFAWAQERAAQFLKAMPEDPQDRQDELAKLITGAMIKEAEVIRRALCPKCQASHSNPRLNPGGAP